MTKKLVLFFVLPLLAFTVSHKFYISVTNVTYSEKDQSIQIITRIFVDDMNAVLRERYGIPGTLGTPKENELDRSYFEKYLRSKFLVSVNGNHVSYDLIGTELNTDMLICYLEIPHMPLDTLKSVAIEDMVLMDLYDDQQNVVHFKINGKKKSFVLLKADTKGMLNL